ncbi:hypothetical protein KZO01_02140 [Kurthia zopfii]|nr:hypothetical protein KZO01_02140 [Kurthia zopfii]
MAIDKIATATMEKVMMFLRPHASESEPTTNMQTANAKVVSDSVREAVAGDT